MRAGSEEACTLTQSPREVRCQTLAGPTNTEDRDRDRAPSQSRRCRQGRRELQTYLALLQSCSQANNPAARLRPSRLPTEHQTRTNPLKGPPLKKAETREPSCSFGSGTDRQTVVHRTTAPGPEPLGSYVSELKILRTL